MDPCAGSESRRRGEVAPRDAERTFHFLAQRAEAGLAVPRLVERDIASNPDWERAFLTTIPVVELAGRRLELATGAARLRWLLDEGLGAVPARA